MICSQWLIISSAGRPLGQTKLLEGRDVLPIMRRPQLMTVDDCCRKYAGDQCDIAGGSFISQS